MEPCFRLLARVVFFPQPCFNQFHCLNSWPFPALSELKKAYERLLISIFIENHAVGASSFLEQAIGLRMHPWVCLPLCSEAIKA